LSRLARSRRGVCLQRLQFLLLATILVGAASCTTITVPPPPTKTWESGEIIEAITQRQEQFRSLRALAGVNYSGPDGRGGFQEAILVQRPDRMRLETLTYLGAVLIVTVNSKEIVGYHPRDGIFLRGQRSKENLARYTQIPLELDEITRLLLGLPPVEIGGVWEQKGNSLVFPLKGGGRDVIIFASDLPVPTQWQRLNTGGEIELKAEFTDYIQTPAGLFPSKILFEARTPKRRLEIRYQEPELNVALSPAVFSQEKPANVKELPIEALGG